MSAPPRGESGGFIIQTERCGLREYVPTDIDDLIALYSGPGVTDFMSPLFEREEEIEYQANYIANIYRVYGFGLWIVCDINTGEMIGRAGVEYRPDDQGDIRFGSAELGYMISPKYQNRGIGTEVCRAILDYARDEIGLYEVTARVDLRNTPSVRIARKLGLRPTGKIVGSEEVLSLIFPENM